jgi:rare lipoprotein A
MRRLTLKDKAKIVAVLAVTLPLAACGNGGWLGNSNVNHKTKFSSKEYGVSASPRLTTSSNVKKGGGRYQVGKPYKVAGKWYHPKEEPGYDKVGVASWYGPNFHGRLTANGEIFDQNALSAAHPTLPLPSYVRVTNVANGQSTLVRVNDRGPFAHGRMIDLSSKTADVLGIKQAGTAKVRVQYVGKAPLNGDDTRFLVASINRITDMERGSTQLAYASSNRLEPMSVAQLQNVTSPTPPARTPMTQMPGFGNDATDLLVSSYAANGANDGFINDAHQAAAALANPAMGAALEQFTAPKLEPMSPVSVGVYSSIDAAHRIAQELALLAIVDIRPLDDQSQVVIETLRPGVTKQDFNEYAQSAGLKGFTL